MTARALLAEAAAHGVQLYRIGDRLRWRARAPIPADLLNRLREHRDELRQLVPPTDSIAPSATEYQRIYDSLTATLGTAADLAAFTHLYDNGRLHLPDELARLEASCEQLAQSNAPADAYRAAVEALAALVRSVREAYQRAHQPEPARNGPLAVVIGDACPTCHGVAYGGDPGDGLVRCRTCNPAAPAAPSQRGRR